MDARCDSIEDGVTSLKDHVLKKEKEFEDMQLEKQLDQLRRELAEAKTGWHTFSAVAYDSCFAMEVIHGVAGVIVKANARMDVMQKETDELRQTLSETTGQVQVCGCSQYICAKIINIC